MLESQIPVKVLVINPNNNQNEQIISTLKAYGFDVFTTKIGGAEKILTTDPDVFVIDLTVPSDDGWRVCREIRNLSKMPILVLSLIDKPGMVERTLDAGADEYLLKPTAPNLLAARINTLARRARAEKKALFSRKGAALSEVS
jgi:DNA-binding response OmpR family regulator